jgi:CheY-like chemotaxis protein
MPHVTLHLSSINTINMATSELFLESFLDIHHDPATSYLHADWKGYQSIESMRRGCDSILQLMIQQNVDAVLNDNTHVIGAWSNATQWVAENWFPRMKQDGLRRFAWAYGPSKRSQMSADITVEMMGTETHGVRKFHNRREAIAWLNQDRSMMDDVLMHRPHVLVIEDNSDFSELFHSMLHVMGCNPEITSNAAAGLDIAMKNLPEMIFCDIGLPGDMNGYEFANAVRSNQLLEHIPLIAVSGHTNDAHKERAAAAGFDRVFPKPVKFADISEALATFSQGRPRPGVHIHAI